MTVSCLAVVEPVYRDRTSSDRQSVYTRIVLSAQDFVPVCELCPFPFSRRDAVRQTEATAHACV
jgi:hypothetical protein